MTDDWLAVLRQACEETSQAAVARRLGISPTVVSLVLKGTYKGDLVRIEGLIRGAYMAATVMCPAVGEISLEACLQNQAAPFKAINSARVRIYRACRSGCPNSKLKQEYPS